MWQVCRINRMTSVTEQRAHFRGILRGCAMRLRTMHIIEGCTLHDELFYAQWTLDHAECTT